MKIVTVDFSGCGVLGRHLTMYIDCVTGLGCFQWFDESIMIPLVTLLCRGGSFFRDFGQVVKLLVETASFQPIFDGTRGARISSKERL